VSCLESLSCDDSPLSITGNVVGILTFAVALILGAQAYFNSLRNASMDIYEMDRELGGWYDRMEYLEQALRQRMHGADNNGEMRGLIERASETHDHAASTIQELRELSYVLDPRHARWWRLKYLMREGRLREMRYKTEKALQDFDKTATDAISSIDALIAAEELDRQRTMDAKQEKMQYDLHTMALESMVRLESFSKEIIMRSEDASVRLENNVAKIEELIRKLSPTEPDQLSHGGE